MRHVLSALLVLCVFGGSAGARDIRGSGSTFVYAVMTQWIEAFEQQGGAHIVYQPIGSAAGITEIHHDVVDFAVTEAPLDGAQLLRDGLAQFPLVLGAVVPVVNLAGVAPGQLRMTGPLLADIYLGKITNWNDPAIVADNPGLSLPNLKILVVHRSDGSGSSAVWTDFLSKASNEWKARVGTNTRVAWPVGSGMKHNGGVGETVARMPGAIGYVDSAYAARQKLAYALVRNHAGFFVSPETAAFEAATADVDWAKEKDFYISLTDAADARAWPIIAASFVVIHRYPKDPELTRDMRAFFRWVLSKGRDLAIARTYLPLPPEVVQDVEAYWATETH